MNKYILLFPVLFFSKFLQAQNTLKANWKKNDTTKYNLIKLYTKYNDKKVILADTIKYIGTLNVMDKTSTTYNLSWKTNFSNIQLLSKYNLSRPILEKIKKINLPELLYSCDQNGNNLKVQNWEEVSKIITDNLNEVIAIIKTEKSVTAKLKTGIITQLTASIKSEKGLVSTIYPELNYMHNLYNTKMQKGNIVKSTDKIPNISGGEPLVAERITTCLNIDENLQQCTFSSRLKLNDESCKKFIESIHKISEQPKQDLEKKLPADKKALLGLTTTPQKNNIRRNVATNQNEKMMMTEEVTYLYNYLKGLPIRIESEKISDISVLNMIDNRNEQLILEVSK